MSSDPMVADHRIDILTSDAAASESAGTGTNAEAHNDEMESERQCSSSEGGETYGEENMDTTKDDEEDEREQNTPQVAGSFTIESAITTLDLFVQKSIAVMQDQWSVIADIDSDATFKEKVVVWWSLQSVDRRNKILFSMSLMTVVPITRRFVIRLIEKAVYFILTIVGTSIGIAIGVGFGLKLYSVIQEIDTEEEDEEEVSQVHVGRDRRDSMQSKRGSLSNGSTNVPVSNSNTNNMESNSYSALMASAGYAISTNCGNSNNSTAGMNTQLRGQIIRNVNPEDTEKFQFIKDPIRRNSIYRSPSIDNTNADGSIKMKAHDGSADMNTNDKNYQKGISMLQQLWPDLAFPVQKELGILVDYIVRDYVMSWYHFMDDGVGYHNEKEKRIGMESLKINEQGQSADESTSTISPGSRPRSASESPAASMILSTTPLRTSPFLEIFYTSLTQILGKFTTLCKDVNVPHLVLVKFMHILKVNIRTYKDIRKITMDKQRKKMLAKHIECGGKRNAFDRKNVKVTEIALVREYLLQGKFHKAITFGMDVPGLLFGDTNGQACPISNSHKDGLLGGTYASSGDGKNCADQNESDRILQQRLFGNGRRILHECELDYNRLLSHRLCRIVLPKADFSSPVIKSAAIELLAACVLTPSMGCFSPDYVNGWIQKGVEGSADANKFDNANSVDGQVGGPIDDDSDIEEALEDFANEMDNQTSLEDDEDLFHDDLAGNEPSTMNSADEIMALLAMSLIELQAYIDFDEARDSHESDEELNIHWNDQGCIETVRNLVLVLEAMLMNGVLLKRRRKKHILAPPKLLDEENNSEFTCDAAEDGTHDEGKSLEYTSLIVMLMEMTSDLDTFETEIGRRSETAEDIEALYEEDHGDIRSIRRPKVGDLSTLRTLIAAWLHTGVVYRAMSVLMRSGKNILHPFYHNDAFIQRQENVDGFLRQLRLLDRVDILVDTMTILSHPPLDVFKLEDCRKINASSESSNIGFFPATSSTAKISSQTESDNKPTINIKPMNASKLQSTLKNKMQQQKAGLGSIKANFESNRKRLSRFVRVGDGRQGVSSPSNSTSLSSGTPTSSMPHHNFAAPFDFHPNEALATSLRAERHARMMSFWNIMNDNDGSKRLHIEMICRSRSTAKDHVVEHRDLHNLAKGFYSNTNVLILRMAKAVGAYGEEEIQSMLLMESVTTRRKMDVPDDDSSFLLRAQPRPLTVVNIHRDQRSHNLSYKKYSAYFDEAIADPKTKTFRGARLRRKCFLRYYPNDRTASINFVRNDRNLDDKIGRLICLQTSGASKQIKEFERYLCSKVFRKGSERPGGPLSSSILASTVMDSNDFCSVPRSGKASDFVFRMSLFEEPEVELSGKNFVVQDSSAAGHHQADASSLEISDAALSTAIILGEKYDKRHNKHFHLICNDNNVPVCFLKLADERIGSPLTNGGYEMKKDRNNYQRKNDDGGIRPYKLSFVRAALLVMSARKEAQLKCLVSDSAKNVTKHRTDLMLRPTLSLLDFATSRTREKQSVLLRDLKLGINHIDREQLKRSGILNPRYPTRLKQLKVVIVGTSELKSTQNIDLLAGSSTILYQLRCIAVTEYVGVDHDSNNSDDLEAEYGDLFREEWIIQRTFKDFNALHKFLKSQVNTAESSAGTGAKLVGAATGLATAALTLGTSPHHSRSKRKPLIPSLSQAVKVGALGSTKKCIEKRKDILNEYLGHLLSTGNLLNRCPELLRFVGAHDPLPESVKVGEGVKQNFSDSMGRIKMSRTFLQRNMSILQASNTLESSTSLSLPLNDQENAESLAIFTPAPPPDSESSKKSRKKMSKKVDPAKLAIIASIKSRIDRVKLSQVRGSAFELLRYIFDLDSANFFRSQMFSALKTMSIAITSTGHGFKRTILEAHLKYINSQSIASHIKLMREILWPNGVIFTSAVPLTPSESMELAKKSRKLLAQSFPDQLAAVLGNGITESGLDLLHEMLQNRLVLKSMTYMMLDSLLMEIFPEIGDILTESEVLDNS